jgi:hypothetical protein
MNIIIICNRGELIGSLVAYIVFSSPPEIGFETGLDKLRDDDLPPMMEKVEKSVVIIKWVVLWFMNQ